MLVRRHIWTNENWCSLAVPTSQPASQPGSQYSESIRRWRQLVQHLNVLQILKPAWRNSTPVQFPVSILTPWKSQLSKADSNICALYRSHCIQSVLRSVITSDTSHDECIQTKLVAPNEVWGKKQKRCEICNRNETKRNEPNWNYGKSH